MPDDRIPSSFGEAMHDRQHAPSFGLPAPIRRTRENEVFRSRYGRLYNDEVLSPAGRSGTYLRWQWTHTGVVVVPATAAAFALVPTYRYPVGAVSLEFPRGGCEPGEAVTDAAVRELREEAGLEAEAGSPRELGVLHAETGLIESSVRVVSVTVRHGTAGTATPEEMESVAGLVWVPRTSVLSWLGAGRITCGITVASLALAMADSAV